MSAATERDGARVTSRRERLLESGLAVVVVGVPLAFLPASASPFVDLKLVLLLAGTLLIVLGTEAVDRLLCTLALLWVAILCVAAALGVDPMVSISGADNLGTGLLLLGPCAALLVCATGVREQLARRLPLWILITSLPAAGLAIASRLAPDTMTSLLPSTPMDGATLGHPVMVSGMCAAGVAAAIGVRLKRPWLFALAIVVLGSGLAISTRRVGLLAVVVALIVAGCKARPGARKLGLVLIPLVVTVAAWTVADSLAGPNAELSGAGRLLTSGVDESSQDRLAAWNALSRSIGERPILGWGPGNALSAHIASATTDEVHERFNDAHNLYLESVVTSGIIGLIAALALTVAVIGRAWKAPRDYGWASGVAAGLLVLHLVQPMSVGLTPLLFLSAGLATGPPSAALRERAGSPKRAGAWALVAALVAALALSGIVLVASVLQRYGSTYNDRAALQAAWTIAPWRITGGREFAIYLAIDARAGAAGDRVAAFAIADRLVREHPDDPQVRLIAADVHVLALDEPGAARWRAEQIRVFPADARAPGTDENATGFPDAVTGG